MTGTAQNTWETSVNKTEIPAPPHEVYILARENKINLIGNLYSMKGSVSAIEKSRRGTSRLQVVLEGSLYKHWSWAYYHSDVW